MALTSGQIDLADEHVTVGDQQAMVKALELDPSMSQGVADKDIAARLAEASVMCQSSDLSSSRVLPWHRIRLIPLG